MSFEESEIGDDDAGDAYALSKSAAEVIVRRAVASFPGALRAQIVRLPLLTWSSQGGVANSGDWLVRLVNACLEIGMRPACQQVNSWYSPMEYLPVDVCADIVSTFLSSNTATAAAAAAATAGRGMGLTWEEEEEGEGRNRGLSRCCKTVHLVDPTARIAVNSVLEIILSERVRENKKCEKVIWEVVPDTSFLHGVAGCTSLPFAPLAAVFRPARVAVTGGGSTTGIRRIGAADASRSIDFEVGLRLFLARHQCK